jgi:copper chaperone CopZ
VLLGVGSFALASVFEMLRPYLLTVAGVFLSVAFYRVYRVKPADGCIAGTCPVSPQRQKLALWIGLGAVLLFAAFPYYSGFFWTHLETAGASTNSAVLSVSSTALRSASLHIDGMFCSGCAAVVESALSHVDGVQHVSVSLETKTATVQYDPAQTTLERLQAAVSQAGYRPSIEGPDTE